MELNDAVRRIFWQHVRLILFFVALGVGLALLLHAREVTTYTASSRLVLDTADPESRAESAAIADTAEAIATSPSHMRKALGDAGFASRDRVAVSVRALGSSGVLELSITDRDPRAATSIANALADRLIETRLAVTEGQVNQVVGDIDRRLTKLNERISHVDAEIDALSVRAATAAPARSANALRARRNEAARLRDFLAQQRSVLEGQRASLLASDALRPTPSVISRATPPDHPDRSRRVPDLVLGGLLGLVLGVGLAALIESFRPKLVGSDALARELDTPLLGTLPSAPDEEEALQDSARIAARLGLAAEAASVRHIRLLAVGRHVDLEHLADRLNAAGTGVDGRKRRERPQVLRPAHSRVRAAREGLMGAVGIFEEPELLEARPESAEGRPHHVVRVRPFNLDNGSATNGDGTGLVLVSPTTVRKTELLEASHLLRVTRMPLLGLITYSPSRFRRLAPGPDWTVDAPLKREL